MITTIKEEEEEETKRIPRKENVNKYFIVLFFKSISILSLWHAGLSHFCNLKFRNFRLIIEGEIN